MLMLLSFPLNADLTGDGVDESIEIGTKSIIVRDGATGKRYIPIRGEKIIDFLIFPSTDGSRSYIAVITSEQAAVVGGRNVKVLSSVGIAYEPQEYVLTKIPVTFYNLQTIYGWAEFGEGFITFALARCGGNPCFKVPDMEDRMADVDAGAIAYYNRTIDGNSALLANFTVIGRSDHDIRIKVDYDESQEDLGRIKDTTVVLYNPDPRTKSLVFFLDNSYSMFTGKAVHVRVLSWKNPYVF